MNNIQCPVCESKNVIKKGLRETRRGKRQRYYCKDCKRRFTDNVIRHTAGEIMPQRDMTKPMIHGQAQETSIQHQGTSASGQQIQVISSTF